jgi:AcrR family transcriptional regulator/DNA-binding XRE family transcriptional regulator
MVSSSSRRSVSLGSRIRSARHRHGWSMRELAQRLHLSAATVSALENGRTSVSVDRLTELAVALEVTTAFLLGDEPVRAAVPPDWREFGPLRLDHVVAGAVAAFRERGYHGSSMRTIADGAGVSIATLYHHYPSKHDLLVRIVELTMDDLDWRIAAAAAESDEPLRRLGLIVEALALFHMLRADLAFLGSSELRSIEEPQRQRIAHRRRLIQTAIDAEVAEAGRRGQVSTTMPGEVARAVASMCTSLPSWFRPERRADAPAIAAEYARVAVRALAAPDLA